MDHSSQSQNCSGLSQVMLCVPYIIIIIITGNYYYRHKLFLKLEEGLATTIRILRRLEKGGGTGRTIDTTPSDQVEEDPKYTVRV